MMSTPTELRRRGDANRLTEVDELAVVDLAVEAKEKEACCQSS
jgi:hypothetical protein